MRAYPSDRIGRGYRPRQLKKKKKRRGILKRLRRWLLVSVLLFIGLTWAAVLPLRWLNPPSTAFMLQDQSGRQPLLHEWLSWQHLNGSMPIAVVASEDQKFVTHFGFDVKSIRDSVENFSHGAPLRGASTISQQVAKNLYLWSGKSFLRKGIEAYLTILVEITLPKRRILEIYLNIAEFGPGIYGVGAASELFFGKTPNDLSDREAALLAAVLPNPKQLRVDQPSAYVRERQRWIQQQMTRLRSEGWITSLN